ncbi:hypothetical protein DNTS_017020, partial [Danionella cerebrum]
ADTVAAVTVMVMAEPLSETFDDVWQDFNEFKKDKGRNVDLEMDKGSAKDMRRLLDGISDAESALQNTAFTTTDITHFDENLRSCFINMDSNSVPVKPLKTITEDTTLRSDEIWKSLSKGFGQVLPMEWHQSYLRSLHIKTLSLEKEPCVDHLDPSDEEDLREQMDLHSIIVSCIDQEPVLTAEQVIEEIEELLRESPESESEPDASHTLVSGIAQKTPASQSSQLYEQRVRLMALEQLSEELRAVESAVRGYSETLVELLSFRDELDFEKEVKNGFISALIDVQTQQKQHREMLRKKKRGMKSGSGLERVTATARFSMEGISSAIQNGFRHTFGNGSGEKQYLTTVIPYEKKDAPPSIQDLQIFTKILVAMRDDSDKVPSLLTDYILKVLCPT